MVDSTRIKRTVAPASLPIGLAETKVACDITGATQDSLIEALMYAAVDSVDGFYTGRLGRAIVTQTWEMKLDDFSGSVIKLPCPPLQSVTSITYRDSAGDTQTLPAAYYEVDTHSQPGRIVLADGYTWPTVGDYTNAVTITFVCGYGTVNFTDGMPDALPTAIPEGLRTAIKLLVRQRYEERFGDPKIFEAYQRAVDHLLAPYRVSY